MKMTLKMKKILVQKMWITNFNRINPLFLVVLLFIHLIFQTFNLSLFLAKEITGLLLLTSFFFIPMPIIK